MKRNPQKKIKDYNVTINWDPDPGLCWPEYADMLYNTSQDGSIFEVLLCMNSQWPDWIPEYDPKVNVKSMWRLL